MAETLDLYERDFFAWTQDQAARLRALRPNGLDVENLAEEVETLGRSERRAVVSLMRRIVHHLLKLEMLAWGSAREHWQRKYGCSAPTLKASSVTARRCGRGAATFTWSLG